MGDYKEKVEPKLEQISEYKAHSLSNEDIANHLGITYQNFQKMIKSHKELADALVVGEDMLVDKAESALYTEAFRKGNITAIKFILQNLNPGKWGDKNKDKFTELPEIKIEMKDARLPQEYLDEIVSDIAHLDKSKREKVN